MSFFVRIQGSALLGGGFPFGTSVDHYTATFVSGPSTLPTATVYHITESFAYDGNLLSGSYVISVQAYSALGVALGAASSISFSIPAVVAPVLMATGLKIVENPAGVGSGQGRALVEWRNCGGVAAGTLWGSVVITLGGPTTSIATITTQGQQYVNFTGLINGIYTASFQNYDITSATIGPSANQPNRFLYYDETLDTFPIALPTFARSATTMPEGAGLSTSPV